MQSRIASDIGGVQQVVAETATSVVQNVTLVFATVVATVLLDWRPRRPSVPSRRRSTGSPTAARRSRSPTACSTIPDADEIVVLHGGRIVERGTHLELLAAGGRYAGLVAGRNPAALREVA